MGHIKFSLITTSAKPLFVLPFKKVLNQSVTTIRTSRVGNWLLTATSPTLSALPLFNHPYSLWIIMETIGSPPFSLSSLPSRFSTNKVYMIIFPIGCRFFPPVIFSVILCGFCLLKLNHYLTRSQEGGLMAGLITPLPTLYHSTHLTISIISISITTIIKLL